jgi:valyl-tRNA synthetase
MKQLIRYNKLSGKEVLWMLGLDHAGIETQFVFEKQLKKKGESRFQYDRETLYQMIWDFVMENKHIIKNQMKKLGFALDWSKEKFTMDPDIVKIVYSTFQDLYEKGLVYRGHRLVNYCTSCGTSFSDLEVEDREIEGTLYYISYPLKGGGSITVATTRPETLFGDVAVMVNPKDKRYKDMIGKSALLPLTNREIPVIADTYVDVKFGTGAVKVTPNHDHNDFEVGKRHNLTYPPVIGFNGRMQNTGLIDGLKVKVAREETIKRLQEAGLLMETKPHHMVVKVCYRCGNTLEPLPKEQWFINVKPLSQKAIELVEKDEIKIVPKRFKKQLIRILANFIDWNISRQIVWGIRIPAYECQKEHNWFVSVEKPHKCQICGSCEPKQDEDTFDTWFSSAQWPFATLQSISTGKEDFFSYFYPTSVMETGYDILRAWVARMIMMGYYRTKKVPFETVFLHGMVRDKHGVKMSKSKGNVINPLEMVEKYGADALRGALVFGTKEGGDVVLSEDKIIGMRNFANKMWNIGRFITMNELHDEKKTLSKESQMTMKSLQKEFTQTKKKYHAYVSKYQLAKSFDLMYDFIWHRFADFYIEQLKEELKNGNIETSKLFTEVYTECLKMVHPYMPFVTDAIWKQFKGEESSILESSF